ncbi:hypothetical protein B0A50_05818 [Salinomyces thailandicus]|uniref:ADP-ribosylation factor n=1 Tax=Salinomyces thailandicus TaxID=706561 RepID=A0A4U0TTU6_9PEZI|nr:hypothetical protein B0A50_05818 [Salinomyces thailandica]
MNSTSISVGTMDATPEPVGNATTMDFAAYYDSFDDPALKHGFRNLDDHAHLGDLMQTVSGSLTRNFVLDFNDAAAYVQFDLSTTSISSLLNAERPEPATTRWINVWYPYHHRPLLELLAKHYDFSPRLLGLMCSDPMRPGRSPPTSQVEDAPVKKFWSRRSKASSQSLEIEKGVDELSEHSSISSYDSAARGNLYRIVDDIWHYSSVDFGRNYICVGYNSLYGTKCFDDPDSGSLLPHCKRVWTWLLLCKDSTIITINEDPFPFTQGTLSTVQRRILKETRRNLTNVFRALSNVEEHALLTHNPMTLLPLRTRLGCTPEETVHRESDVPGLLFYYLFENWHNSYTLVTRKESRYGRELTQLRHDMFQSPQFCHLDRLDAIGKELGVLKRHYQSYTRLLARLLEPRLTTPASLENSRIITSTTTTTNSPTTSTSSIPTLTPAPPPLQLTESSTRLGVPLSAAAQVRFKRLADLIDLYALAEITTYLDQKDSLTTLNFNLIALKDSLAMERLTRVTLLITKATILFLPVSLMSAYFSIDLSGGRGEGGGMYTVREYWVSFGVILFLSWVALVVLGVFSGSVETGVVLRGLWRGIRGLGGRVTRGLGV